MPSKKTPTGKRSEKEILALRQEHFSGPLPPPSVLRQYDETVAGAAERIMRMAEKEQEHRIFSEQYSLRKSNALLTRGQVFGFVIVLLLIALGTAFVFFGFEAIAIVIFSATTISLAVIFVLGRKPGAKG